MKKVVNGFRYDTEKACLIGEASATCPTTDLSFWEAGLYVTPRAKRYFLAGEGGPMTSFGHRTGNNSWTAGSKIIPLSEAEAFEWTQQFLDGNEVEKHFGHLIEEA